jgi:hypothetical protein
VIADSIQSAVIKINFLSVGDASKMDEKDENGKSSCYIMAPFVRKGV